MNLYEKVKEEADRQGISISAVEKKSGIANGTIGKWRCSKGANITSLVKVSETLGVDAMDLISVAVKEEVGAEISDI